MVCTLDFSFMRRRHHCRACGKVVCGSCSAQSVPLAYMDNKPGRVCPQCFEEGSELLAGPEDPLSPRLERKTSKRLQSVLERGRSKRGRNKEFLVEAARGLSEADEDVLIAGYLLKQVGID